MNTRSDNPPTPDIAKPAKKRKNVVLSKDAIDKGIQLQKADKRSSFSNWLEWMIDREYSRQFPNGNPNDNPHGHAARQNSKLVAAA